MAATSSGSPDNSLVLLISAGLFIQTLRSLERVAPGFETAHLAVFRIEATPAGYAKAAIPDLHLRLQERLGALPGVRAVTAAHRGRGRRVYVPPDRTRARDGRAQTHAARRPRDGCARSWARSTSSTIGGCSRCSIAFEGTSRYDGDNVVLDVVTSQNLGMPRCRPRCVG